MAAASAAAAPKTIPTLAVTENDPSECLGNGSLDFTFTGIFLISAKPVLTGILIVSLPVLFSSPQPVKSIIKAIEN